MNFEKTDSPLDFGKDITEYRYTIQMIFYIGMHACLKKFKKNQFRPLNFKKANSDIDSDNFL